MRPVDDIDPEFFAPDEPLTGRLPLLDAWLALPRIRSAPLAGYVALLVQHQLSNQIPMLHGLLALGLSPGNVWWLDIPYTSNALVRDFAHERLGIPREQLAESRFEILQPYASYQHARVIEMLHGISQSAPTKLLVLDDGAYVLEGLASMARHRWPERVAIVEQTTRGFIKLRESAALRNAARELVVIDVARSKPKRALEPPFIAMAVCAALQPHLERHFGAGFRGNCLVLGYGAIGEQVATYVRRHFRLPDRRVFVHDPDAGAAALARQRRFPAWDRDDLDTRFQLVIGCSGEASFKVGDSIYLEDGAILVSASSGAVELSRQDFLELADASPSDDIIVVRDGLDQTDIHSDLSIRLVDRSVTFINGGFPVNFNGRLTVCPTRYIQPTPTMMVAAACQAAHALDSGVRGIRAFDPGFYDWAQPRFQELLGDRAHWLEPVPEEAW